MAEEHTEIEDEDADEGLPYRTWCPHCIKGRGKEMKSRDSESGRRTNRVRDHMDYCFPEDEMEHTKMKKAVVVPSKGSTERYVARQGRQRPDHYPQN